MIVVCNIDWPVLWWCWYYCWDEHDINDDDYDDNDDEEESEKTRSGEAKINEV